MLAFVHINKTGGNTLQAILRRSFGPRHCEPEPLAGPASSSCITASELRRTRRLHPRLESVGGHWIKPWSDLEREAPDIRYWTFLREPVARAASNYAYRVRRGYGEPFEEWIAKDRWRNRTAYYLCGRDDPQAAIDSLRKLAFVGVTHEFDASLVMLRALLDIPRLDLRYRTRNVASDRLADQLLASPRRRALLEDATRSDREVWDVAMEEIIPEQKRRYGARLERDVAALREAGPTSIVPRPGELAGLALRQLVYKPWLRTLQRRARRSHQTPRSEIDPASNA